MEDAIRTEGGDAAQDWESRLAIVVETMREMSRQTDPQAMVRAYGRRVRTLMPSDGMVALSRRDLNPPQYRITRSSLWKEQVNPWKDKNRLPLFERGLLGELLYGDKPRIIQDLQVAENDPAAEYLQGQRALMALPLYDSGVALNMVVLLRGNSAGFDPEELPQAVWMGNLFGRATHNLVLAEEVQAAYDMVDRELRVVADMQRTLLPTRLPDIPTLDLAVHYQTAHRAGGDYYDFFALPDDRWGLFIADVSGHGTPAAVVMAIAHCIAHMHPGPPMPPSRMLTFLNEQLIERYTGNNGTFVTAFYSIYDPHHRRLTYASAGHPPPRLQRCGGGEPVALDDAQHLPLGIRSHEPYEDRTRTLEARDRILFFTDGVTEAMDAAGEEFGIGRLDAALAGCHEDPQRAVETVLSAVHEFTAHRPNVDDQTLLLVKVK
jgi:sigma-B regulation protein RsbU (phosphoserine phosphatase)